MKNGNLVWVDCEMTGLDPQVNTLVEIAVIITDGELNILDKGIDLVIHASSDELAKMEPIVHDMHTKSGLLTDIQATDLTISEAEDQVMQYIKKFIPTPKSGILSGNSIGTDRLFLHEYMPELDNYLHYRVIDVSTIKELAKRWYPKVYFNKPAKGLAHRALADIKESIEELKFYRETIFTPLPGPSTEEINQIKQK